MTIELGMIWGSSIKDVTVLGEGITNFVTTVHSKGIVITSLMMGGGDVENRPEKVTSFMDNPLTYNADFMIGRRITLNIFDCSEIFVRDYVLILNIEDV